MERIIVAEPAVPLEVASEGAPVLRIKPGMVRTSELTTRVYNMGQEWYEYIAECRRLYASRPADARIKLPRPVGHEPVLPDREGGVCLRMRSINNLLADTRAIQKRSFQA